MVAWVVIDRRHHRQAGPFALPLSTPLFPPPHLSPLLPYSYGHSYTTATHQPLCNQSLTHSFYLDGGVYPPAGSPLATAIPTQYPLPTSSSFFSHACALFCTFLHFFALTKNSTPLFSIVSALFAKNHPWWGTPQVPCQKSRTSRSCSLGLPADPFYRRPDPLTVC